MFLDVTFYEMVTPDNIIMPSRKPRVALTIPDDIHSVLDRMSELTGVLKQN